MDFDRAFGQWLADPTQERFEALRQAVRSHPSFHSNPDFLPVLRALDAGDYRRAQSLLLGWMPGACLSPLAHTLLSRTHLALGEEERAVSERALAQASLHGIVSSGDGSEESPWRVLRVSDEYDVLDAMGQKMARQFDVSREGERIDRLETTTGETYWFVLDLVAAQ